MKTCPHEAGDRLLVSGPKMRKALSEGSEVTDNFSRPQVLAILRELYANLADDEKVEVNLDGKACLALNQACFFISYTAFIESPDKMNRRLY